MKGFRRDGTLVINLLDNKGGGTRPTPLGRLARATSFAQVGTRRGHPAERGSRPPEGSGGFTARPPWPVDPSGDFLTSSNRHQKHKKPQERAGTRSHPAAFLPHFFSCGFLWRFGMPSRKGNSRRARSARQGRASWRQPDVAAATRRAYAATLALSDAAGSRASGIRGDWHLRTTSRDFLPFPCRA